VLLSHRRRVAAPVERFVGFVIGLSIPVNAIAARRRGEFNDACAVTVISQEYPPLPRPLPRQRPRGGRSRALTTVLTGLHGPASWNGAPAVMSTRSGGGTPGDARCEHR